MRTREELLGIAEDFRRDLERLPKPQPGPNWIYREWAVIAQTVIDLEKMAEDFPSVHLMSEPPGNRTTTYNAAEIFEKYPADNARQ